MVTVLNLLFTVGVCSVAGIKSKFLLTSCKSTNSSKVKTIRLLLKFKEESAGLADISLGGKVSLGPPPGGTITAQPLCNCICKKKAITAKRPVKNFEIELPFI